MVKGVDGLGRSTDRQNSPGVQAVKNNGVKSPPQGSSITKLTLLHYVQQFY